MHGMKTSYIFFVVLLAIVTGIFISTMSAPSKYASFTEASMSPETDFTVIGNLNKEKPIEYNPKIDPNLVTFYVIDKQGKEYKVHLNQSKPQDMERSEDIVIKGKISGDAFYAHTILLKCPSKYEEQNITNS